jgi:dipeptidyl aminopeptidase/acylaminoacyl peptidase
MSWVRLQLLAVVLVAVGSSAGAANGEAHPPPVGNRDNGVLVVAVSLTQLQLFEANGKPAGFGTHEPFLDSPRFSPDGRRLAFFAGPNPDRAVPWIADAHGHHARALVPVPNPDYAAPGVWSEPVWSPDGRELAYSASAVGCYDICAIHIRQIPGGGDRVLRLRPSPGSTVVPDHVYLLEWRGSRMLLNLGDGYGFLDLRQRVIVRLPGGAAVTAASLSPAGDAVAYTRHGKVFVLDLTGHRTTLLRGAAGIEGAPVWSPDEQSIAFVRRGDVYVIPRAGGKPHPVASGQYMDIRWSPDGQLLLINPPVTVVELRTHRSKRIPLAPLGADAAPDFGAPMDWQPR